MNVIITILISLISGLAGVFVGSLLNQKKEIRQKKLEMLSILITKRYSCTDEKRTEVLNCIPLIFQKNQHVCDAFDEYKKAHDVVTESLNNPMVIPQKMNYLQDCYVKIMEEMAKDLKLGSNFSWDKLKNIYIPKYYTDNNGNIYWY